MRKLTTKPPKTSKLMRLLPLSMCGLILMLPLSAFAQNARMMMRCGSYTELMRSLANDYKEALVGRSVVEDKVVELYTAKGGETWTIVIVLSKQVACIVANGSDWKSFEFTLGELPI